MRRSRKEAAADSSAAPHRGMVPRDRMETAHHTGEKALHTQDIRSRYQAEML
jgi:hypothetical protein